MKNPTPKIIGLVALLAWAHGLLAIWPLPSRNEIVPVEMQWSMWWESLVLTAVGLFAAFLALRSIRFWWLAILLTSGVVLALNLPAMISDITRAPTFSAWFALLRDHTSASFLYFLLGVPLYHLIAVCATLVYGMVTLAARARASATVA
jgi:hypothetical protein